MADISKKLENKKIQLGILLVITAILIFLPFIIRWIHFSELILPGDVLYYDLRIAEDIKNNALKAEDQLSFVHTMYKINPFHYLLVGMLLMLPPIAAVILLMVIFSSGMVFFLFKTLENLQMSNNNRILVMLLFIISPLFVTTLVVISKYTLAVTIAMAIVYLYTRNGTRNTPTHTGGKHTVATICALMVLLLVLLVISLPITYVLLVALLFYDSVTKKRAYNSALLSLLVLVGNAALLLLQIIELPQITALKAPQNIFQQNIAELGTTAGFGIFTVFLFLLGLYLYWKDQQQQRIVFWYIVFILVATYLYSDVKYLANIVICLVAAIAAVSLLEREWKLTIIKDLSIFVLILGVLFSGLATVARGVEQSPGLEEMNSFQFLKEYALEHNKGYVLSHSSYGHQIQAVAVLPVIVATTTEAENNITSDINIIFYSRDIKTTIALLQAYTVRYILITEKMKSTLVWKKENQGLLFLLDNSERFKKIYQSEHVEIWELLP